MLRISFMLFVLVFSHWANAFQEGYYAGGGLGLINSNQKSSTGEDISFTALELHGGYKYAWYLGGELRVGFSSSSGDYQAIDTTADSTVDYFIASYYRIESMNEVAKLYGLLGFASVEFSTDFADGSSSSGSESGFSYGVGVGFADPTHTWTTNFEYRQLIDEDALGLDLWTITVDRRFSF